MKVYLNKKLIMIETNLDFAIPYWTERKRQNKNISWEFA